MSDGNEILGRIMQTGMLNAAVYAGIQIDINAVWHREGRHAAACDHNCTIEANGKSTGGNYVCPAATSLNKGIDPRSFAPLETIVGWVETAMQGHDLARARFLQHGFDAYCARAAIPPELVFFIRDRLTRPDSRVEVNIFGGNPEMHPHASWLIQRLADLGAVVNFTTTGRRFMTDSLFVNNMEESRLTTLALSVDDIEPEVLKQLVEMSLSELKAGWKTAMRETPMWGQRLKAYEAVYAARMAKELGFAKTVLFNMVMHGQNLDHLQDLFDLIHTHIPGTLVNPYPSQSSFLHDEPGWSSLTSRERLEQWTDTFIQRALEGTPGYTKRLHYWLFLKATFERFRDVPHELSRRLSGYDGWRCYRGGGSARYLQIGCAPPSQIFAEGDRKAAPGGHVGCFWNSETVTQAAPVQRADQVADYLERDIQMLAASTNKPCSGCIMPRLMFDMVSTEAGMDPLILPSYLELRRRHVGF